MLKPTLPLDFILQCMVVFYGRSLFELVLLLLGDKSIASDNGFSKRIVPVGATGGE